MSTFWRGVTLISSPFVWLISDSILFEYRLKRMVNFNKPEYKPEHYPHQIHHRSFMSFMSGLGDNKFVDRIKKLMGYNSNESYRGYQDSPYNNFMAPIRQFKDDKLILETQRRMFDKVKDWTHHIDPAHASDSEKQYIKGVINFYSHFPIILNYHKHHYFEPIPISYLVFIDNLKNNIRKCPVNHTYHIENSDFDILLRDILETYKET